MDHIPADGCCEIRHDIDPADYADEARRLKALGDPNRLAMLALMRSGSVCVCDFVEPLGLRQPTVSHHLKLLYDAGLVVRERRGQWVYYSVDEEALAAVAAGMSPSLTASPA